MGKIKNSNSCRVYNPATRRIMETRNVSFIETPSRLFPPSLEENSRQIIPQSNGMDDHNYITDVEILCDLRHYTSVLERLPGTSAGHNTVGGLSDNPPVSPLGADQRDHQEGHTGRRSFKTSTEKGYARGIACGWRFVGGRSRTAGAAGVARGSLPRNITGWITPASAAGAFASRIDACNYICRHWSKIIL